MAKIRAASAPLTLAFGLMALMRPKQWVKNGFVLAPLLFTGQFINATAIGHAFGAMILFCIASSAVYIINDIQDIERDRAHPKKSKTRPLAAGIVTIPAAMMLLVALATALLAGYLALPKVVGVLAIYLGLNVAYSFKLKHEPVLDIFTIAIGFVLRVYAGAVALAVPVSAWMFITTLCLALFLASIKRRQELRSVGNSSGSREILKKYSVELVDRFAQISATGALVFYSMFVVTARPEMAITIPFVLFGLFRYWYIVDQLDGGESPTETLLTDFQLIMGVLAWVVACASVLWPA
ncbi:MAG: decaprenyl-phosphate phosphoribosyltransferase [Beijerinckiaceae bacterium]